MSARPWWPGPEPRSARRPQGAFHLLVKPTGAICNLDCDYCFFLTKESLYPGSRFRMADDLLEQYVRQLLEAHAGSPEVTVAWQGGEPTLMGVDFFRRAVELVERLRPAGQRVVHTIQTNATLLDDVWAELFTRYEFLVGVSVDGPRDLHDAYRVDKGGKPTFDRVMAGLGVLQRHGVDWNALTTVHAANADHGLEVYRFLRDDLRADYIQFIPIVEPAPRAAAEGCAPVTDRSVPPEGYGQFLVEAFEEWVRHDVGRVFVQIFDVALGQWLGTPPSLCVHAETCGRALALEHTGDVYSCDHFVDPAHLLGNIGDRHLLDIVSDPAQRAFGRAKRDSLPRQCRECPVRFACHGGCPKDRLVADRYGDAGLNYLCPSYTRFFQHVDPRMRRMRELIRTGGDPTEIMSVCAEEDVGRGPGTPCPCARPASWVECHGRSAAAAVRVPS